MDSWDGNERRSQGFALCPMHRRLEDKIDKILEQQTAHYGDIVHLKDAVDNGLKATVVEIREHVVSLNGRMLVIEDGVKAFSWFQTWVTLMRDNLFKNVLKLAFIGIILWLVAKFGNQLITKIIAGL